MINRTRYFVILSLLVVGVGLGTGLVAYYVGFPASAFLARGGPEELRFLPSTAAVLVYANVRDVMSSDLRQRLRRAVAADIQENGQREFQNQTGIDIETDIDRVVGAIDPSDDSMGSGVILARGRFDETKIEALMREHGAQVESYKGKRLIVAPRFGPDLNDPNIPPQVLPYYAKQTPSFSLMFIEPGLVAFGTTNLVRHAVDLHTGGGENVTTNDELMKQVQAVDGNAWVVGRFDLLRAKAKLPDAVANQLPPITWFSASTHINGGLRAVVRAEARDEPSAENLRDVVRGLLALAKLQTSSQPAIQTFAQSIQLGGTGTTVSLSFDVPGEVFDVLGAALPKAEKQ